MRIPAVSRALRLALVVAVLAAALPLAGCGRKGAPEHPPGSDYPRTYPNR